MHARKGPISRGAYPYAMKNLWHCGIYGIRELASATSSGPVWSVVQLRVIVFLQGRRKKSENQKEERGKPISNQ